MPQLTDLTPAQVLAQVPQNAIFVGEDPIGNIGVQISLSLLLGEPVINVNDPCMVKLMTRLREACASAQEVANQNQGEGERLNAFPPATSSGTVIDGYVTQAGAINSRIKVSTATEIVGTVS